MGQFKVTISVHSDNNITFVSFDSIMEGVRAKGMQCRQFSRGKVRDRGKVVIPRNCPSVVLEIVHEVWGRSGYAKISHSKGMLIKRRTKRVHREREIYI